jgi:chemotaxis protein MotB
LLKRLVFYWTLEKGLISTFYGKDKAMRIVKISLVLALLAGLLAVSGCGDEMKSLRIQNSAQRDTIADLTGRLRVAEMDLARLQKQLATAEGTSGAEVDAMRQKVAALEEDIAKKKALIASMQQQLLYGGGQLPVELSTMLEDFAKGQEMITFDASKGVVKFKSDLLFEKGSDVVAPTAVDAVKKLCEILNTEEGKNFDVIIAGHTDDMRIGRPETRAKHPTNWHLSSNRAIAVLSVMESSGIAPDRMSVRGFGEYRPVEENKPNKQGNPANRRVEIYIVAKGV